MTCLVLIRHGPTAWNNQNRLQGRSDIPLSESGREQVAKWVLAPESENAVWYSSPLIRALETAHLLGASDPRIEPMMTEMSWGDWEGSRVEDLRRQSPGADLNNGLGLNFRPPGGESRLEVLERIRPFFTRIGKSGKPSVAVTHKGVIEAAMVLATGWDMRDKRPAKVGLGASHVFDVDECGEIRAVRLNDLGLALS